MAKHRTNNRIAASPRLDEERLARMVSRAVESAIERVYKPPQGANVQPISQQMLSQMQTNFGPQKDSASAFSPGSPIAPTPGVTLPTGPRGWTFPIGYNIGQLPRSTESTSFDTLRNLASLYDGIMLCEQVWSDYQSKMELQIKPKPAVLAAAGGDAKVFEKDIAKYKTWFEMPDLDEGLDLHSWLNKATREQLELDALAMYVQPNRGGGVYALQIIDGSTLKPLIDNRGRRPVAPFPAYQQFWYGVPLGMYTSDQMIYHRETQRADSIYGLSRVERIILRINQALRKQNKDLARFTEGNLPPGTLELPETDTNEWTPDQIIAYQQIWDGLLGGNDKVRSRLKMVPPGSKYTAILDPDIMTDFDRFLLNTTVACFGLTMDELAFTETSNRSVGDSQENVVYRRAMRPLMNRYARLLTMILKKYFHEDRFLVSWGGYEETEDIKMQADAYGELIGNGQLTIEEANRLMNLPYEEKTSIPRFIKTATGPIFFQDLLDPDIRDAQKQAKLTGLQLAQHQPGAASPETGEPTPPKQQKDENDEEDTQDENEKEAGNTAKGTGKTAPPVGGKDDSETPVGNRAASSDYRRWRDRAIDDIRHLRPFRSFSSDCIPVESYNRIAGGLGSCTSADDVKRVFELERTITPADTHWQVGDPIIAANLAEMQAKGTKKLTWKARPGCCDSCLSNDGKTVEVGKQFPSGAYMQPNHNHCECKTVEEK